MEKYEIKLKGLKCLRCYHKWYPRENKMPGTCPKCKSPYYNKERKRELIKNKG